MDVWDGSSSVRASGAQRAPDRIDWDENVKQVAAAQTAVNVNITDIGTNLSDIGTNVTDIGTNVTGISDNVTAIGLNTSAIGVLEGTEGTPEVVTGLVITESGTDALRKTVFTFTSVELSSTDGTVAGTDGAWAALKLYEFPAGVKIVESSSFLFDLAENNAGADGFTATADFDIGLGSVASAQATAFGLATTQSDYNEATVALTGSTSTADTDTNVIPTIKDGVDLYLNLRTIEDTDHGTTAGLIEVTGVATVLWRVDDSIDAATTTDIATVQASVVTNTSDIGTNVTDIGTNVTDIANALAGINANATHTVGAVTSKTGLTVAELGDGAMHKTVLTLTAVAMASTDATTDGARTTQELYTFPEGHIIILAAHAVFDLGDIVATTGGDDGYSDAANLGIGVGTVAANAGTGLDGTEEDICTEMDVNLTSKASDAEAAVAQATSAVYDGSTSAIKAILNTSTLGDGDHGANPDTLTVTGTITIVWTTIGDDA